MPLCSVIVHICNIYVNRKENIGIMKLIKVMLCHLTATICSSPKDLMFKSLMKKKIVSYINVKLFLQRDENRKSLPCTRKCNVMENLTNVNVFMRLWTDMAFLVLVLVLYMCISKCMWCVKDLYSWWSKIRVGKKSENGLYGFYILKERLYLYMILEWNGKSMNITWNSKLQMSENKHFIKYLKNFVAERVFFLSSYASLNLQRYTSQKRAVCISWN